MKNIILIFSFLIVQMSYGQVSTYRNLDIELVENDSATSAVLQQSLNVFLSQAQQSGFTHEYVDTIHLKKYEFFFNKLSGIGKSNKRLYNAPLILKSYPIKHGEFRLTIAFTGEKKGVPFVIQVTELKAVPYKNHFRFHCPFDENTRHFKTQKFDNITYHYSGDINKKKAKAFVRFVKKLARLTKTKKPTLDYYCFASLDELLKSYGFLYSAKQCNFLCYDLGFTDNEGKMYITGTNNENYNYGYISDYLYYNLPRKNDIYWTFVRGMQTYYGGYGLSYENIDELKKQFRQKLKENPTIDFLQEFKKGRKSTVNRHFSHYVMSTFLYQEALEKHGFDTALQLIYSGKRGEHFFENLEKYLQISEANFHAKIVNLIGK